MTQDFWPASFATARLRNLIVSTFLLSLAWSASPADVFPDGPFSERLQAFVEAVKDPTRDNVSAFVSNHMSDELAQYPMDAHLEFFQATAEDLGSFSVLTIEDQGGGQFYVDVQPGDNDPVRLLVEFDPNPPYGLIGAQPIPMFDMSVLDIDDTDRLHAELQRLAEENKFSGALYLEDGDKVVFQGAYGQANKRYGIPNTLTTRFAIGSITKAFTKLAALKLLTDEKLQLNDPVEEYAPELPSAMHGITIWQLLRHESGLTEYFGHPDYQKSKQRYTNVEDYLPVIADLELEFAPGTARRYSNAGYVLLGIVIQRASGANYHDFVREHVFKPLGMVDTDFEQPTLVGKPYAVGYTNLSPMGPDSGFVRENSNIQPGIGSPAGTSYSTIADLLKFEAALWKAGSFDEETLRLYHSMGRVESEEEGRKAPFPRAFSAAGGQPGENSVIISVPEFGRRVVVLSNYDERLAEDIGVYLYEQLKERD